MKKPVIMFLMFAAVISLSFCEIAVSESFYEKTLGYLSELEESFEARPEDVASEENIALLDKLDRHWNKGLRLILMLGNHTLIRNAEERLTALDGYTRLGEYSDAYVSLRQSQRYISDLLRDIYPSCGNLL